MIVPKYRRNKIGKKVAIEMFNKYPGNWEVSSSFGSKIAYSFWNNVILEYTAGKFLYNDGVFSFKN